MLQIWREASEKNAVKGQSKDLQKKSKKIDWPGTLKVFCYSNSLDKVDFEYLKEHKLPAGPT